VVVVGGGARLQRYWELGPPREDGGTPADAGALIEELGAALQDAVARHLVSDVPLGIFLSGGVDSAGLAALARRAGGPPPHTLTVTFDEPGLGEGRPARETAALLGTEHHELQVTLADFRHQLEGFFQAVDQPTHDGLNTYLVARAARKAGLTVALSGAGGDEIFWGYRHHRWLAGAGRPLARVAGLPRCLRAAAAGLAWAAGAALGREGWRRLRPLGAAATPARLYLAVRGFFAPEQVSRLTGLGPARLHALAEEALAADPGPAGEEAARAVNRLELARYLHDQLLRDTDVFGMAHAVEVRVPYLDHELVERLWRVPRGRLLRPGWSKPLLAEAVAEPVVTARARAPKRGFTLPMDRWLRAEAGELEALAVRQSGLDRAAVRAAWRAFRAGRLHWSRAWALAVLGASRGAA
jgi:asparagine synthase (glutamine-hydrolysing)